MCCSKNRSSSSLWFHCHLINLHWWLVSSLVEKRWASTCDPLKHIVALKVFSKILWAFTTSYVPVVDFISFIIRGWFCQPFLFRSLRWFHNHQLKFNGLILRGAGDWLIFTHDSPVLETSCLIFLDSLLAQVIYSLEMRNATPESSWLKRRLFNFDGPELCCICLSSWRYAVARFKWGLLGLSLLFRSWASTWSISYFTSRWDLFFKLKCPVCSIFHSLGFWPWLL